LSSPAAPRRRTQKERVEESNGRLIVAAIELFGKQGYERTSAEQIGIEAGYSRGMVHRRYGSKERLLRVLFETELRDRLTPVPDDGLPGLEQICEQVDRIIDFANADERMARAFFVLCFETASQNLELGSAFRDWFVEYEDQMKATLRRGQADGSITASLNADYEAQQFVSNCLGLAYRWLLDWDRFDFLGAAAAWRDALRERYSA